MQLDQASLEKPDLEARTKIRRFARKAKESNRLDVVQHLREITPAGTTGKSAKLVCFVSVHLRYIKVGVLFWKKRFPIRLPATQYRGEFSAEITKCL